MEFKCTCKLQLRQEFSIHTAKPANYFQNKCTPLYHFPINHCRIQHILPSKYLIRYCWKLQISWIFANLINLLLDYRCFDGLPYDSLILLYFSDQMSIFQWKLIIFSLTEDFKRKLIILLMFKWKTLMLN